MPGGRVGPEDQEEPQGGDQERMPRGARVKELPLPWPMAYGSWPCLRREQGADEVDCHGH